MSEYPIQVTELEESLEDCGFCFAFRRKSRRIIRERAGGVSELSGMYDRPMECAHIDHTRNRYYQSPRVGLYLRDIEHYYYHLMHRGCANLIGLTEEENDGGLQLMLNRIGWEVVEAYESEVMDMWSAVQNPYELIEYKTFF